jgi:hypothetical protein
MTPKDLLQFVEDALLTKGLTPTQFGLDAIGDPNLVRDLRNGRELRWKTAERVMQFIRTGKSEAA